MCQPPGARRSRPCATGCCEVIRSGDRGSLLAAAASDTELSDDEIVSNAAVLLFGGIETTEGMIANAVLALLAASGRAGAGPP